MESLIKAIKYLVFNYEIFVLGFFIILFLIIYLKKNTQLEDFMSKKGKRVINWIDKLIEIKTWKLLLVFFIINFVIRLFIVLPVSDLLLDFDAYHYLNLAHHLYKGEGYITEVIWTVFLRPETLPSPDFFRPPMFPLLIALFYKIFGLHFFSAKLVSVILGASLPLFLYGISLNLTKSKRIAGIALILMSLNSLYLAHVSSVYTEIAFAFFFLLVLLFLSKFIFQEKRFESLLFIGAFWGFLYLTRTQAFYTIPVMILAAFILFFKFKKVMIYLIIILIGFLLATLPWLGRNYLLTRNPFPSELPTLILPAYFENLTEEMETPYSSFPEFFKNEPLRVVKHWTHNFFTLVFKETYPKVIGSLVLTFFTLIGFMLTLKEKKKYLFLYVYIIINYFLFSFTWPFPRYLYSLNPLFLLFAALGVDKIFQDIKIKESGIALQKRATLISLIKRRVLIFAPLLLVFVLLGGVSLGAVKGTLPYTPHSFYERFDAKKYFKEKKETMEFLQKETGRDEAIMVSRSPYEFHYFTQKKVVNFPFCDNPCLKDYIKNYNVRFYVRLGEVKEINSKFLHGWPEEKIPLYVDLIFKNSFADVYEITN